MGNRSTLIIIAGLLAMFSPTLAQEQPADEPAAPPAEEQPEQPEPQQSKKKTHMGLYVSFAVGTAKGEPLNTSIITRTAIDQTESTFEVLDQLQGRASIGWQLANAKGDFRFDYKGFVEDSYKVISTGQSSKVFGIPPPGQDPPSLTATGFVKWWDLEIDGGQLSAQRTPRFWDLAFDSNDNGVPDPDEVQSTNCSDPMSVGFSDCTSVKRVVPESLNNRFQTYDFVYGRIFGKRRFTSRWWAGLRYFNYTGQISAPAWLMSDDQPLGTGFSDGEFIKLLLLEQESKGWGPTGSWEVRFNFFQQLLSVYLRGQAAFVLSTIKVDSGPFFTIVKATGFPFDRFLAQARLLEKRDKSTWQNTGELGVRIKLRNNLRFELGYSITGYLDAIILPSLIVVPETQDQINEGVTALYGTQDYDVEGWHVGMSFQFK